MEAVIAVGLLIRQLMVCLDSRHHLLPFLLYRKSHHCRSTTTQGTSCASSPVIRRSRPRSRLTDMYVRVDPTRLSISRVPAMYSLSHIHLRHLSLYSHLGPADLWPSKPPHHLSPQYRKPFRPTAISAPHPTMRFVNSPTT